MYGYRRFDVHGTKDAPTLAPVVTKDQLSDQYPDVPAVCHRKREAAQVHLNGEGVPAVRCTCGYHAYHSAENSLIYYDHWNGPHGSVMAWVWGHGRVIEHDDGFRASRLQIVAFFDTTRDDGDGLLKHETLVKLAQRYGVPILDRQETTAVRTRVAVKTADREHRERVKMVRDTYEEAIDKVVHRTRNRWSVHLKVLRRRDGTYEVVSHPCRFAHPKRPCTLLALPVDGRSLHEIHRLVWGGGTRRARTAKVTTGQPRNSKGRNDCLCGCGGKTGGRFCPGHDARVYSYLRHGPTDLAFSLKYPLIPESIRTEMRGRVH